MSAGLNEGVTVGGLGIYVLCVGFDRPEKRTSH